MKFYLVEKYQKQEGAVDFAWKLIFYTVELNVEESDLNNKSHINRACALDMAFFEITNDSSNYC
jgi:hypothetical protein